MPLSRYLEKDIESDLEKKMVFLAGPRQVGKTTLAKQVMQKVGPGAYYLWDRREDRREILKAAWPADARILLFDELHKYKNWKQWIKGEYDKHRDRFRFLVTGSARLDVYRRGGDSLQGRYHHHRLHPFSVGEVLGTHRKIGPMEPLEFPGSKKEVVEELLRFSGFPEPFVAQSEKTHRRWQKERLERFFREDVRDLEQIRDLSLIQILSDLLPSKVGSLLSLNSLREDLEVSHRAVTHWMDILERLYFVFRIRPFTSHTFRGLKKEAKAYLWDWTLVSDTAARFENLIASHLLKFCHHLEDSEGHPVQLHYLRDLEKREVDFLISVGRRPWVAVEAKISETGPSASLRYYGTRLKIPFLFQVILRGERDFLAEGIRVLPASKFLSALP